MTTHATKFHREAREGEVFVGNIDSTAINPEYRKIATFRTGIEARDQYGRIVPVAVPMFVRVVDLPRFDAAVAKRARLIDNQTDRANRARQSAAQ